MTDQELKQLVESNARAIQGMIEQRVSDRLEHEQRISKLENIVERLDRNILNQQDAIARLIRIEEAQNRMLASMDEDRPTVLRKLDTIDTKLDRLLGE